MRNFDFGKIQKLGSSRRVYPGVEAEEVGHQIVVDSTIAAQSVLNEHSTGADDDAAGIEIEILALAARAAQRVVSQRALDPLDTPGLHPRRLRDMAGAEEQYGNGYVHPAWRVSDAELRQRERQHAAEQARATFGRQPSSPHLALGPPQTHREAEGCCNIQ